MEVTNKLAPHLTGQLSPQAQQAIADRRASGALSPFATPNAAALRRNKTERDQESILRPAFVRDAEKIMHMSAYNRLAGKTQVFSFRADDDLARRGLHVQLVARVARDIGAALGLNLDLIEAIALGHDIGHTPFGHAGERFLNDVYHARTGRFFAHNVQSVRVLDVTYGRNLALQTLDGVICHNGEFEQQVFETSSLAGFDEFDRGVEECWEKGGPAIAHLRPMTLEGCVVRVSDIIAYVGKDRQDAIRAGLCTEKSFDDGLGGAYNAWALENYEKIYGASEVNGDFSRGVSELFSLLYDHELEALRAGDEAAAIFRHHIEPLGRHLAPYGRTYDWKSDPDLAVVDFISSMTDDYFMATCSRLFPKARELFPRRGYFEGIRP